MRIIKQNKVSRVSLNSLQPGGCFWYCSHGEKDNDLYLVTKDVFANPFCSTGSPQRLCVRLSDGTTTRIADHILVVPARDLNILVDVGGAP